MPSFPTHYIAIFNLITHEVEGIEEYSEERALRDRLYSYDLECQGRGKHLGWTIYDSTTAPFSWDIVTPPAPPAPPEEAPDA